MRENSWNFHTGVNPIKLNGIYLIILNIYVCYKKNTDLFDKCTCLSCKITEKLCKFYRIGSWIRDNKIDTVY